MILTDSSRSFSRLLLHETAIQRIMDAIRIMVDTVISSATELNSIKIKPPTTAPTGSPNNPPSVDTVPVSNSAPCFRVTTS